MRSIEELRELRKQHKGIYKLSDELIKEIEEAYIRGDHDIVIEFDDRDELHKANSWLLNESSLRNDISVVVHIDMLKEKYGIRITFFE